MKGALLPNTVGDRGTQGIPGPPGPAGPRGQIGKTGGRGISGRRGATGARGKIGTAPNAPKEQLKVIRDVDKHLENIYRELDTHIGRMAKLQREIDELRARIRTTGIPH
jgi:hypothetical protein